MSKFSKIFEYVNRLVTIEKSQHKEIINYDIDNKFPQNLIRDLNESGTATLCVETIKKYGYAEGLVDENLGNTKINDKQTINKLLAETFEYSVPFRGYAYHVLRSTDGKIAGVYNIPFENVRKKLDGSFVYNETFSGKYEKSKDVIYPEFRGEVIDKITLSKHIEEYGTEKGEILYVFNKKPLQYDYPVPPFYSSISDINADSELSKYELETINNSFLPSGILTVVGDIDNKNPDEGGKTEWDYMEDTLSSFTGIIKDKKGESGRQKLAVLHAKTKDEIPNYQALNNEGILTASEAATKRIAEKVARAFGVPPFLIGLGGNVGFATNIISDNITLFNNNIKDIQLFSTKGLQMCFPSLDLTMTQLTPIKYIAPEIYAQLDRAEIRALAGYKTETNNNGVQTTNN